MKPADHRVAVENKGQILDHRKLKYFVSMISGTVHGKSNSCGLSRNRNTSFGIVGGRITRILFENAYWLNSQNVIPSIV
jgi:hypothetical protein